MSSSPQSISRKAESSTTSTCSSQTLSTPPDDVLRLLRRRHTPPKHASSSHRLPLFDRLPADERIVTTQPYDMPDEVVLQLSHRDVNLGFFKDRKDIVLSLRAEPTLRFDNNYLHHPRHRRRRSTALTENAGRPRRLGRQRLRRRRRRNPLHRSLAPQRRTPLHPPSTPSSSLDLTPATTTNKSAITA